MYLFTTVPHPHGHWQLQELLGNIHFDRIFLETVRIVPVQAFPTKIVGFGPQWFAFWCYILIRSTGKLAFAHTPLNQYARDHRKPSFMCVEMKTLEVHRLRVENASFSNTWSLCSKIQPLGEWCALRNEVNGMKYYSIAYYSIALIFSHQDFISLSAACKLSDSNLKSVATHSWVEHIPEVRM